MPLRTAELNPPVDLGSKVVGIIVSVNVAASFPRAKASYHALASKMRNCEVHQPPFAHETFKHLLHDHPTNKYYRAPSANLRTQIF